MVRKQDVKIIFIDYISLITPEDSNLQRHEKVAEMSRSLKSLARELKIPVVALSQVGRQSEGTQPGLADLRESGSIEQDADVVVLLHRDRPHDRSGKEHDTVPDNTTKVIIAKQRNGPTGAFNVKFVPETTRFENITSESP
jgi:replicative DNA helicase